MIKCVKSIFFSEGKRNEAFAFFYTQAKITVAIFTWVSPTPSVRGSRFVITPCNRPWRQLRWGVEHPPEPKSSDQERCQNDCAITVRYYHFSESEIVFLTATAPLEIDCDLPTLNRHNGFSTISSASASPFLSHNELFKSVWLKCQTTVVKWSVKQW